MAKPHPDTVRAARAGQQVSVVCRWILNTPTPPTTSAASPQEPQTRADGRHLGVDGALVLACLLHLTDHRESAQCW